MGWRRGNCDRDWMHKEHKQLSPSLILSLLILACNIPFSFLSPGLWKRGERSVSSLRILFPLAASFLSAVARSSQPLGFFLPRPSGYPHLGGREEKSRPVSGGPFPSSTLPSAICSLDACFPPQSDDRTVFPTPSSTIMNVCSDLRCAAPSARAFPPIQIVHRIQTAARVASPPPAHNATEGLQDLYSLAHSRRRPDMPETNIFQAECPPSLYCTSLFLVNCSSRACTNSHSSTQTRGQNPAVPCPRDPNFPQPVPTPPFRPPGPAAPSAHPPCLTIFVPLLHAPGHNQAHVILDRVKMFH